MIDRSPRERIAFLRNGVALAEAELAASEGQSVSELWAGIRKAPVNAPSSFPRAAPSATTDVLLTIARAKRELGDATGAELAMRLAVARAGDDGSGLPAEVVALGAVALAEGGRSEALAWLDALANLSDVSPDRDDARVWEAWTRLYLGQLEAAFDKAQEVIHGRSAVVTHARVIMAWSALLRGQPMVVLSLLDGSEAWLAPDDPRTPRADAAALAAMAYTMRGETAAAQAAMQRADAATGDNLDTQGRVDAAAASILLQQGQPAQARTLAQRAQRGLPAAPTLDRLLPAIIEAEACLAAATAIADVAGAQMATLLGDGRRVCERVRRATQAMSRHGGTFLDAQARRIAAELEALFGMHTTTRALNELEGIAHADESPSLLEQARALVAVAQVRGRLADPTAATWREQAVERANDAGAISLAQRLEETAERSARNSLTTEVRSRELELLLEVGRAISSMLELDPLLEKIMDALIEFLNGERGFLMLYDEPQPRTGPGMRDAPLRIRVARNMGREAVRGEAELSQSVVAEARRSGDPVIVNDAGQDDRFANKASVMLLNLRSVLCLPLRTNAHDFGLVYVENRSLSEIFGTRHLDLVRPLTAQAALAIDNAFAYQRNQKLYEQTLSVARARERILNHVSHELKTPIAIVSGALSMVAKRLADDERALRSVTRAERNIQRLIDIQQHMLDIYEARHGEIAEDERPTRVRVDQILREEIDAAVAEAKDRELELAIELTPSLYAHVSPKALRIAFAGFFRNAIENTPDEGKVEVLAYADLPGTVAIIVRDRGVGITADSLPHVFEGFFHTQSTDRYSSKRPFEFDAGGKGLDLLRIRALAERNGWELELTSTRCRFIPTDADACPGRVSQCQHCPTLATCHDNGGTEVRLVVPAVAPIRG